MTEIEKVKSEIKVLEAKLSFLEELEKTKSPVEEAFKRVFSYYPEGCEKSFWISFQKGYEAAMQDYKVGEYQEPEEEQGSWNYDPDAKFRKQKENEWKNVALEFGKNLPVSLPHSYDELSPNAWYRWVVFTYDSYIEQRDKECGYTPKSKEVKKLQEKDWTYKISDEHGETNPYKQYLNSVKDYQVEEQQPKTKNPETLYNLLEELSDNSSYGEINFEDAYNVAKKWLDDNTEILDEDYDTVTLKLSKGMLK